jgi:hypothetical protein
MPRSEASTLYGLYSWAKKYVEDGAKTISLEEFRQVFGLEPAPGIFARKHKIIPFRE